jgi:hypothetical protein
MIRTVSECSGALWSLQSYCCSMKKLGFPGSLVFGLVFAATAPQLAHGRCHAADFDYGQMSAVIKEVRASVENLVVLVEAAKKDEMAVVSNAMQVEQSAGDQVGLFSANLILYGHMTTAADRQSVDDMIGRMSVALLANMKSAGDFLTQAAALSALYGGEIREARDRVRKLQALFSCAGGDK